MTDVVPTGPDDLAHQGILGYCHCALMFLRWLAMEHLGGEANNNRIEERLYLTCIHSVGWGPGIPSKRRAIQLVQVISLLW